MSGVYEAPEIDFAEIKQTINDLRICAQPTLDCSGCSYGREGVMCCSDLSDRAADELEMLVDEIRRLLVLLVHNSQPTEMSVDPAPAGGIASQGGAEGK